MKPKAHLGRLLPPLLIPAVVLFLALIALQRLDPPPPDLAENLPGTLRIAFYGVSAAALLLSVAFNRSRAFFCVAVLGIARWGLMRYPWEEGGVGPGNLVHAAVCALLPFNLLLFSLFRERGFLTPIGILRGSFVLAQVVLVMLLNQPGAAGFGRFLLHEFTRSDAFSVGPVTQLGLMSFTVAFVGLGVRLAYTGSKLDAGSLGALVASAGAVHAAGQSYPTDILLNAGALLLAIAVIQDSHGKAYIDELTGVPGRRALEEALLRLGGRYAIAMVDVDHFKKFNDKHGHDVGDQVLRAVAARLQKVEAGGRVFRYGGEEFSIVFKGRTPDEVFPHLERVRELISGEAFTIRAADRPKKKPDAPAAKGAGGKRLKVTVSIGVAGPDDENLTPPLVIDAADKALYKAKKKGRNRTMK